MARIYFKRNAQTLKNMPFCLLWGCLIISVFFIFSGCAKKIPNNPVGVQNFEPLLDNIKFDEINNRVQVNYKLPDGWISEYYVVKDGKIHVENKVGKKGE